MIADHQYFVRGNLLQHLVRSGHIAHRDVTTENKNVARLNALEAVAQKSFVHMRRGIEGAVAIGNDVGMPKVLIRPPPDISLETYTGHARTEIEFRVVTCLKNTESIHVVRWGGCAKLSVFAQAQRIEVGQVTLRRARSGVRDSTFVHRGHLIWFAMSYGHW